MCTFNAVSIAPRQLMLQKAQHCAPKRERIYPLQFLGGVYENSVRAEKSLRTLPEKKVLTFSRNAFQKKKKKHLQDRNSHSVFGYVQQPVGKHEFRSAKLTRKNVCTVLATRREQLIKVALVKATKHKANPATDEVRSVASRKTRISIRQAQQKKRLYRSRHEKRTTN